MKRIELQSHFIGGIMLVTNAPTGRARARAQEGAGGGRPEPDDHQRRTMREQVARSFDQERAVASLAGLFGIVALRAGGGGALRRHGVYRRAADRRDRHSDGARRRSPQGGGARAALGVPPRPDRARRRRAAGRRRRPPDLGAALRRGVLGSACAGDRRLRAGRLRVSCGDHPRRAARRPFSR